MRLFPNVSILAKDELWQGSPYATDWCNSMKDLLKRNPKPLQTSSMGGKGDGEIIGGHGFLERGHQETVASSTS